MAAAESESDIKKRVDNINCIKQAADIFANHLANAKSQVISGLGINDNDEDFQSALLMAFDSVFSVPSSNIVTPQSSPLLSSKKPIRVYVDGCFDLMHSGHYNAIRQAKALGDILVCGIHSDEEILTHKGLPVMNEKERLAMLRACKWVDEIAEWTPYNPTIELLDSLNCDFCVHGDDTPSTSDGRDAYSSVKEAGRIKIIKRTPGISTTDLVGRLLLFSREHLGLSPCIPSVASLPSSTSDIPELSLAENVYKSPVRSAITSHLNDSSKFDFRHNFAPSASKEVRSSAMTSFIPTTCRISQFANRKIPQVNDKVVYIDGAFDLFHVGHVETLQKAKKLGTFLIVGIHDDSTVNQYKGYNYPIMNLHERVLNVLACKYVDEVVIGASWVVNEGLITSLKIDIVVSGTNSKLSTSPSMLSNEDPYAIAKSRNIYQEVDSLTSLSTDDVIRRIISNRLNYQERNKKPLEKQDKYLANRSYVAEI